MSCVFNIFSKWDNSVMVEFQIEKEKWNLSIYLYLILFGRTAVWWSSGYDPPNPKYSECSFKQMLIVKFVISANMLHLVKSLREEIVVMSSVKVQVFDIWSRCKVLPGPAVKACCFQFTEQSSQDLSHYHQHRCSHIIHNWHLKSLTNTTSLIPYFMLAREIKVIEFLRAKEILWTH